MIEIKTRAVIAIVGVTRTESGKLCTEEMLRGVADGERHRYDEASQSLIYHGPFTEGDWGRAVYTDPLGAS